MRPLALSLAVPLALAASVAVRALPAATARGAASSASTTEVLVTLAGHPAPEDVATSPLVHAVSAALEPVIASTGDDGMATAVVRELAALYGDASQAEKHPMKYVAVPDRETGTWKIVCVEDTTVELALDEPVVVDVTHRVVLGEAR